jgi:hypothetical protein
MEVSLCQIVAGVVVHFAEANIGGDRSDVDCVFGRGESSQEPGTVGLAGGVLGVRFVLRDGEVIGESGDRSVVDRTADGP